MNFQVRANAALDDGNVQEVCEAYKQLAKYFAQMGRLRTAEFFFQKCLHLSKEAGWFPGELEANLALGIVYEELGDVAIAVACHERRLELAAESGAMVCVYVCVCVRALAHAVFISQECQALAQKQ
eukprot:92559-Pelagomonas_calceolata.AAC.1